MKRDEDNPIVAKSFTFALRIVKLYKILTNDRRETVLSKQLLRCGTSIGANIKEGVRAQTRADFHTKMNISLKECSETEYWLELLLQSGYLSEAEATSLITDCQELLRILTSIVKNTQT